jgi:hypothetical protein
MIKPFFPPKLMLYESAHNYISTIAIRYNILGIMTNKNCDQEWKNIITREVKKIDCVDPDEDDIEIVVVDASKVNQTKTS